MIIQPENWWHQCPKCKDVQPVTTDIPLWWNHCPNVIPNGMLRKIKRMILNRFRKKKLPYKDMCLYPILVTKEQEGDKTKCKKCGIEYKIVI